MSRNSDKISFTTIWCIFCLQMTMIVSQSYECNMASICSPSVCTCINDTDNPHNKFLECKGLVTNNMTFFSCLSVNVTEISIFGSDITHLFDNDMNNLTKMEKLVISDSPLKFVGANAFAGLVALKQLQIHNTSVADLDNAVFTGLKLTELIITNSQLTTITSDHLAPIKNTIVSLDLSRNQLSELTASFFTDISNSLGTLVLSGNELIHVNDFMLDNLPNVTSIDLSHNRISSITPNALATLYTLNTLDLSNNVLNTFPGNILPYAPLQTLNISWNVFDEIPLASIIDKDSFQVLDMDGNRLTKLKAGAFIGLPNLVELHMSYIPYLIAVEANAFTQLSLLNKLYMNNNPSLTNLSSEAFPHMLDLEYMYINDNGLTSLDHDMFMNETNLPALIEVEVQGNPIQCSCNVSWIRLEMDNDQNKWIQPWKEGDTAVRCEMPVNFNNTELYHYDVADLTCSVPTIQHHDQFSEVNGEQYYMEIVVQGGIPMTTWITESGMILSPEDVYDPGTGHDIMSVEETVLQNHSVHSKLVIDHPTMSSVGHYTVKATNVAGFTSFVFKASPKQETHHGTMVGLIIGAILGTIILLTVFICVIRVIRQKPVPYARMGDDTGNIQSTDSSVPSGANEERGPFTGTGQRSYGGVNETTQENKEEDPKV